MRITLRCRGFPSRLCRSEVCWRKVMGQLEGFFNQGSSPGTSSRASKCRGWLSSSEGIIVGVCFMVKTPCLVAFLIRRQLCFAGISPVRWDATHQGQVCLLDRVVRLDVTLTRGKRNVWFSQHLESRWFGLMMNRDWKQSRRRCSKVTSELISRCHNCKSHEARAGCGQAWWGSRWP